MSLTEDEWRDRLPEIERIAGKVGRSKNASPNVRDRLQSEAAGHIAEVIGQFNSAKGSFSTWCWTVLGNLCVTMIRKEARERERFDGYRGEMLHTGRRRMAGQESQSGEEELPDDERQPLPDLVPLLEQKLKPIDRLIVAAYHGVLNACGDDIVDRWCAEAKTDKAIDLRAAAVVPRQNRSQAVADALGRKLDYVRTRLFRAMQTLKSARQEGT